MFLMQENNKREMHKGHKEVWTARKGEEGIITLLI